MVETFSVDVEREKIAQMIEHGPRRFIGDGVRHPDRRAMQQQRIERRLVNRPQGRRAQFRRALLDQLIDNVLGLCGVR